MMEQYKSSMNLLKILEEAKLLDYHQDEGYVLMGNSQGQGIPEGFRKLPEIWAAIAEIGQLRGLKPIHVMVNFLKPGAPVPKHRDFLLPTPLQPAEKPCIERWHLAVVTNPGCFWWDSRNGEVHMPQGMWSGPVPYWLLHTVFNRGIEDRLHVAVDLDTPHRIGEYLD
jgi:hypothetical protein